jgi:hypothetical protein
MRTTVRLDDGLLERAKQEAERRGTTLTALIEQGIRLVLRRPQPSERRKRITLPVSRTGGGAMAGVDLNDTAALLDRLDERE